MSGSVTACAICGSANLALILDMGSQPLPERHDSDRRYPLALLECGHCSLVQLSCIADQRELFPPGHTYATGNTKALREHFGRLAVKLGADLFSRDLVVDIAANDGTLINAYPTSLRRVAVEPTDQAWKCHVDMTYQEFFTAELGERIRGEYGPAKVVTACNVLAHVPDPHDFVAGVAQLLADDGVFVAEVHDLRSITEGLQIDTVYAEHFYYYSLASLSHLLAMHGLDVTDVERIGTHGGSFRVTARKRRGDLSDRAYEAATKLHLLLSRLVVTEGAAVYGIGAATRATPLIHFAGLSGLITCVCEVATSEKIGTCMPGTAIPVVDEAKLIEDQPPYALLFSWHIAGSLMPKLREMGYRGKFIIPLPEAVITDG